MDTVAASKKATQQYALATRASLMMDLSSVPNAQILYSPILIASPATGSLSSRRSTAVASSTTCRKICTKRSKAPMEASTGPTDTG